MQRLAFSLVLVFFALSAQAVRAQSASEEQVKAAFVFNFAKLLTWPDERFESDDAPLRVCTVADDKTSQWLGPALEGKKSGERRIEAVVVDSETEADCHLVYLGQSLESGFPKLMPKLSGEGVLLVDEGSAFTWPHGMIRLFQEEGRFRFEMNLAAFESAGLRVDPRMIRLARIASR